MLSPENRDPAGGFHNMSLSLSVGSGTTSYTCSVTVSIFMVPVSFISNSIELQSFSGGEHKKIPCIRRTKELKNKGMQPGSLHLSRRVSKRTRGPMESSAAAQEKFQWTNGTPP